MANYVSRFPDGAAGAGLLLLRSGCACAFFGVMIATPATPMASGVMYSGAVLAALSLVLGFAARLAAVLLGIGVAMALLFSSQPLILAGQIGGCAAIALLGAGAYSVDARLHGRRVVHLRTDRPDRGDGN